MRLRRAFVFISLWISSICLIGGSLGAEWEEEDAVIIEHDIYARKADIDDNDGATSTPVSIVNVEVVPGKCMKFRDCYPILYFSDEEEEQPTITSVALRDFILSTSSPCELSQLPDSSSEKPVEDELYIWCPQRIYGPANKYEAVEISTGDTNTSEEGDMKTTTTASPPQTGYQCGPNKKQDIGHRIVGGREAEKNEFPWTVAILNRSKQFCGGSLISDRVVLLAAHCVFHLKVRHLSRLRVLIGDHDIKDPNDVEHVERNVSKIVFHRNFNIKTIHDDIGLLHLSEPVDTFSENIVPICLPTTNYTFEDGNTFADVSGWGQIYDRGPQPSKLRTANIRIWKKDECMRKYLGKAPGGITGKMLCAGSKDSRTKDACRGDSGSALTLLRGDHSEQIGIVSWGIGCGTYPGVYTKVHPYLEWIHKYGS